MSKQAENIEKAVLARARAAGKGTLLFPDDFKGLGSGAAIRKALQRLSDSGLLMWVAQGIYVIPEESELLGMVRPGLQEIAEAIARRDRARIIPSGVTALNRLGLSTQVPLNLVYLTDGAARKVTIGKASIKFKRTTPRNLAARGPISGLVIQALRAIGKDKATDEEINRILQLLKNENKNHLLHDIRLAPAWIADIMSRTLSRKWIVSFHGKGSSVHF
jgi:hypothetical protein